jgi:hypothetical protein
VNRRQPPRRLEQLPDLIVAVQVGAPARPVRQQPGWWYLSSGIMSAPVASKTVNETEPSGQLDGTCVLVLLGPFHRQRNRDICRAALFEK